MEKLFIRIGDGGSYEEAFDVYSVYQILELNRVSGPIWYHCKYGIGAKGYIGNNYISLYYGTDVESPTRGLNDEERNELNRYLEN